MISQEFFKRKMAGLASACKELIAEAIELKAAALNNDGDMGGEDPANTNVVTAVVTKATKALAKAREAFSEAGVN